MASGIHGDLNQFVGKIDKAIEQISNLLTTFFEINSKDLRQLSIAFPINTIQGDIRSVHGLHLVCMKKQTVNRRNNFELETRKIKSTTAKPGQAGCRLISVKLKNIKFFFFSQELSMPYSVRE